MCRWNYNCCYCRRCGNVRCGNWCQCRCCQGTNTNCARAAAYHQDAADRFRMCYNNGYAAQCPAAADGCMETVSEPSCRNTEKCHCTCYCQ